MSGSLGLGSSESNNNSQSESSGYGYSGSTSTNTSSSLSNSFSAGQSATTQNVAFQDLFAQLYGKSMGAANNAAANAGKLSEVATSLFSGGTRYLEGLSQDAGTNYLEQRLSADNPVLQDQIDLLAEDTGRLFREELNPAITSRAVAGGTLGGGRQGVAQGQAMDVASRRFTEGATALRAADIAARDSAARDVMQGSLAAANTGLGALPGLLDLSERGANQELGVWGQLSQIMGGPTVLSQSRSTDSSRSTASSIAEALSSAFGEDWNSSSSSSRGRSRAWNIEGGGGVGYGMSDRRVKRNITRIGELPNGLPVYRFQYLWSDTVRYGVMADEVKAVRPDAVELTNMGLYIVNYAALDAAYLLEMR